MTSTIGGITQINLLNVNDLFIRGKEVDFDGTSAFLQAEIDAIELQIIQINNVVTRIDFNTAPALVGNLVITEDNKNSVLLTAIQSLQQSIGNLAKLDLTALPANPPGACVITPTTTNQALNALITTINGQITTINGQITTINGQITTIQGDITTIQGQITTIQGQITTIQGQITTINGQITTINGQITAINTKLAHFSTFNYGNDVMSGIADGTGFAAAVSSGSASGNGIFVYPNTSTVVSQIQLAVANDKEILIRGGNAVKIYGNNDGSITNRNRVELGDKTDVIAIGVNNGGLIDFPEVEIGVDGTLNITRDSSTTLKGDVYFSRQVSSTGIYNIPPYTPVMVADTGVGVNFGNCNNFTTDPTFSGLDVLATAGVAPITLTAGAGAIPITAAVGLISLTALAGGITLATGLGVMTINCGAGGFLLNSGAGVMNFASGSGNINMTTIGGDIVLGAGKAVGGTAGNTVLNALTKVTIQPDVETEIYKAAFLELNDNAAAPPIVANRLYQQADALYWNGQLVQGGSSNQYVLKIGDTMTGTLTLPEAVTSILTLDNLTVAPVPVTNRLYLLNGVLTFNGAAIAGGSGFVLKAGDTMTGALNINFDAGNTTPQFTIVNNSATLPTSAQGAAMQLRNDAAGPGTSGERCGRIDFTGRDSTSIGGRTYGSLQGFINDATSTSIDGRLSSFVTSNNTQVEMLRLISSVGTVRQANIAATNTTIGPTAIGSASGETLRVIGTQAITTSLDVPLIQNATQIYSATSTTLVDGAVKRYRPERQFSVTDYPNPLTAPTISGEKCIILNAAGNPVSQVDSILQASDFPAINGFNLSNIVDVRFVEKTATTPAMNVITALYNEPNQQGHLFIQPDVPGVPTLIKIADFYFATAGQALVADFMVTTFQNNTRIYVVGQFDTTTVYGTPLSISQTNNFSGQIVVSWSGSTILNVILADGLNSNSTTQDASSFSNVGGLQGTVFCILNMTGYSGFPQPANPPGDKYDTLVIGGTFTGIGVPLTAVTRPLSRLAYYDWNNGSSGTVIGWRSFQDTNWSVPEGPNGYITGGQPSTNGAMLFAYTGNVAGTTSAYYGFALQYTAPFAATWSALNNDANSISTGSNFYWFSSLGRNTVSGGNPVLPYGPGNAIGYNEVYFNRGYDSGTLQYGTPFRPTAADPYEITDSLVVDALNFTFPTHQLKPVGLTGSPLFSVYRDDTHYPNVFFLAMGSELKTATLPFGPAPPVYSLILLANPVGPLPCTSFGGYNTETGYEGAIFGTDTNAYVYKLTSTGELVIELNGCVVRTYNDVSPQNPVVASNKLTFPINTDGGSVVLCGDLTTVPASWWAISQDGPLFYDNQLIGGGGGIDSVTASGTGITAVTTGSNVVIANTGVTSIIAGTGINVNVATGNVTISASTAPSGTIILNLGKINFSNLNTGQPSVSDYVPLWDGVTAPKQSGICTVGAGAFVFSIDSFNAYTYITWQGVNPITINIKADCSWYSTSGTPYPTGADSEFTNTNTFVNSYAYSAVNFGIEIQDTPVPTLQTFGTSLGNSAINWIASYGGTLSGTGSMKTGSTLRFSARTNYSFNNTYGSAGTYFASLNFGGADQLTITAYESPYPA